MSAAAESIHAKLMRAMGSKSGEWDPMPPTQYEAFMDKRESEEIRILGALLKRTIGRADDGTRSEFARERNGRPTSQAHLALELGMNAGNLSTAIGRLEEQGKIRREMKPTRIYLRADVPAPDLGVAEGEEGGVEGEANTGRTNVFRSENFSARELQFLTDLQARDIDRFRAAMGRIVAAELWGAQVKADAMAWAREREAEQRERVFTELGYTNEETRGRKKGRPSTRPDALKLPQSFEQFSIQKSVEIETLASRLSVQDGKLIVNGIKRNSVQQAHPYGPEAQSPESQLASKGKANANGTAREVELKREAAEAEIKTEVAERLRNAGWRTMGAAAIDAATQTTIARHLLRLDAVPASLAAIREVLDAIEERGRDVKTGKKVVGNLAAYLVGVVKGEVEKRLRKSDPREQVKAAAAGKGF